MSSANGSDDPLPLAEGGSLRKGAAIGLGCQLVYLLLVANLPSHETRFLGLMLFALVQFIYLYPVAAFLQRRKRGLTSNGVILVGVVSLAAVAVWFIYAILHGTFPRVPGF